MSWFKEQGINKGRKALKRLFRNDLKVTNHFVVRLYQRFSVEERRSIVRELYEIVKSGMAYSLFVPGEIDAAGFRVALVTVGNKHRMALAIQDNQLVIKTIYTPGRNRNV